jgi:hypothetical protein
MAKPIAHASRFLRKSEALSTLLAEIARAQDLLSSVGAALPPPVKPHCLHAALHEGTLTLVTDSPVWAARMRFFAPDLVQALGTRHGPIRECRVRVQPRSAEPPARCGDGPRLSPATVDHLLEAAQDASGPAIADALRRLARAGAGR